MQRPVGSGIARSGAPLCKYAFSTSGNGTLYQCKARRVVSDQNSPLGPEVLAGERHGAVYLTGREFI